MMIFGTFLAPKFHILNLWRDLLTMKQDLEENDFTAVYDLAEVLGCCQAKRRVSMKGLD